MFEDNAEMAESAAKRAFPEASIETRRGLGEKVHIKAVSPDFNGLTERRRQDRLWDAFGAQMGDDVVNVSVAMLYGTDEDAPTWH